MLGGMGMLSEVPTFELVDELVRRQYTKVMVPPYGVGSVRVVDINENLVYVENYEGPVVMLVVGD